MRPVRLLAYIAMTFKQFLSTLKQNEPPEVSKYLLSLWYDRKGDWDMAHKIAQDIPDRSGSWIHAYLHRVEGDTWNSNYWYQRAGREMPKLSLTQEWEKLVHFFLKDDTGITVK